MKQLTLPFEPELVIAWHALDRDERHFLCYLGVNDGGMIPPPYPKLKSVLERLKAKGLICDSLLAEDYVELTELAVKVMSDGFEQQRNSGHLFICRR